LASINCKAGDGCALIDIERWLDLSPSEKIKSAHGSRRMRTAIATLCKQSIRSLKGKFPAIAHGRFDCAMDALDERISLRMVSSLPAWNGRFGRIRTTHARGTESRGLRQLCAALRSA
jgi:hypothetical protein